MLFRFCLYGFLKNQRYFEPFLILAFRQKGLAFATIGLLIAFREICVVVMEIPTGAVADVLGRRRAMIASFIAYVGAFVIFFYSEHLWTLFAAMFVFAVGEALRTGTHKAMIFDWLARQGRASEKTEIYGLTRSWSKLGSAVSVIIAAGIVFATRDYSAVFLLSAVPYAANIVNFLTYPKYLDGPRREKAGLGGIVRTVRSGLVTSLRSRPMRRLLLESMGYEGAYKAGVDYLQPVLKSAALALPVLIALDDSRRAAILVGAVYFVLHLLSSVASRRAGRLTARAGGEERSARLLWLLDLLVFALLGVGILIGSWPVAIAAFVLLAVLQNFWRPILISRVAGHAAPAQAATVLSIESQAKSLGTAALAPILGWAVDAIGTTAPDLRFLPVALAGVLISALMLTTSRTHPFPSPNQETR